MAELFIIRILNRAGNEFRNKFRAKKGILFKLNFSGSREFSLHTKQVLPRTALLSERQGK